jgi:quercetin dioxygenase-like cupin family protein
MAFRRELLTSDASTPRVPMAKSGDVLVNPALGARIVFRRTAAETNGEAVEFDFFLRPHTYVIRPHAHPFQEERTHVVAGELRGIGGGTARRLGPGESMVVPPGVLHYWGNDGDEESHWIVEFRPALKADDFLEAIWSVAARGHAGSDGLPKNFFQGVVIIAEFRKEVRPNMPWLIWQIGLHVLAPIGRWLGYSAYPHLSSPSRSEAREASLP